MYKFWHLCIHEIQSISFIQIYDLCLGTQIFLVEIVFNDMFEKIVFENNIQQFMIS